MLRVVFLCWLGVALNACVSRPTPVGYAGRVVSLTDSLLACGWSDTVSSGETAFRRSRRFSFADRQPCSAGCRHLLVRAQLRMRRFFVRGVSLAARPDSGTDPHVRFPRLVGLAIQESRHPFRRRSPALAHLRRCRCEVRARSAASSAGLFAEASGAFSDVSTASYRYCRIKNSVTCWSATNNAVFANRLGSQNVVVRQTATTGYIAILDGNITR